MPGVFDNLSKQIEEKNKEGGIRPLDLAGLPPTLRKMMRVMLRELQASYPRLCEIIDSMPEAERMTRAELDLTLNQLVEDTWLLRIGEGEKAIYKANMRRKEGSKLAAGVWSALDSRLKKK
ncbi:MAG: hypothetical protein Fur002_18040 [Anaerolineales bacterium]